jgi:hypothetical protein
MNFKASMKKESSKYIKDRITMVNEDVMRKFKLHFERDEQGKSRDWVAMEPV